MSLRRTIGAGFVFALLVVGCGGDPCDANGLTAALRDARPGSTVQVGACTVRGEFTVPAGVTLRGRGSTQTVIASGTTAIRIGGAGAVVDSLRVEQAGGTGITATGVSDVTIRNVEIRTALGRAAIGLRDVATATLTDVTIVGPVTPENASSVPSPPASTTTALFGIALSSVGAATLTRVSVSGFGYSGFGALASTTTWNDGTVQSNLGIGVWVSGGRAMLSRVSILRTLVGVRPEPTYALATGGGAEITTMSCTIERAEGGFGVLHDGGSVRHQGLAARGNAAAAIIAQRTTSMAVTGAMIEDNQFGGIIAVEAGGLRIEDSTIRNTRTTTRALSDWGMVTVGDGIQLVRPVMGTVVRNAMLENNERAGVLLDLGRGTSATVALDGVTVNGSGAQLGCVTQNGTAEMGWDRGVTRQGAAVANDGAFRGGLSTVGVLGPSNLPPPGAIAGVLGPSN